MILLLWGLSRADPGSEPPFRVARWLPFVITAFLWAVGTTTMVVTGRWNRGRWAVRSWYLGIPHSVLFGYACAASGRNWPIAGFIYFLASTSHFGFFRFGHVLLLVATVAAGLLVSQFLEFSELFFRDIYFNAALLAGVTTGLGWLSLASSFVAGMEEKVRNLLRESRRDKRSISDARQKSDNLLLNILPPQIAEELKSMNAVRPLRFDSASVLFTDFQGFTKIAESLSAEDLVAELDRCFSYFDSVVARHRLEKLKTIGDSFMCAGGIPIPNHTHAVDCILAAMEIQAFMNQMKSIKAQNAMPYWELRLGIHSGPLVAGVIGEKKFAYDVWGDTVNTASRAESSGAVGRINITGATHSLVKDFFDCEHRGTVAAKNKGEIDMYFVNGIRPDLSREGDGRVPGERFREMLAATGIEQSTVAGTLGLHRGKVEIGADLDRAPDDFEDHAR